MAGRVEIELTMKMCVVVRHAPWARSAGNDAKGQFLYLVAVPREGMLGR